MIRIERTSLPAGLSAIARRAGRGDIVIIVSDVLSPAEQRAAVRAALRAARRRDWRGGLLPLPVFAGLAAFRSLAVRAVQVLRVHSAASWAVASGVTVAAAGVIGASVLVPHAHVGSAVGPGAPGYVVQPGSGSPGRGSRPGAPGPSRTSTPEPREVGVTSPAPGAHPSPRPSGSASSSSAPPGSSRPTPAPGPSSSPPSGGSSPSPSPSTSPGSSGTSPCVTLLVLKVCL